MQTEQLLCWSGMTDTKHSTTSGSSEEEKEVQKRMIWTKKKEFLYRSSSTFFEFSPSLLLEYSCK